ncbi:hypothetical protein AB0940_29170 [Streptomyces sp. NPDC006656]|uniref:hypothetical protein n=1 Tax=Streptomyces sp. NPDC006656 TaxID=3156899 RepID=UPI003453FDDC
MSMETRSAVLAAQERLRAAHIPCREALPDIDDDDYNLVREAAFRTLRDLGSPLDAPGHRLYILSFVGPISFLKTGRTEHVLHRVRTHENAALVHRALLVDAWVSRPYPNARRWEESTLNRLRGLPGAISLGEYFYNIDFDTAVSIAQSERSIY